MGKRTLDVDLIRLSFCHLCRKITAYDEEIQHLYEEMEQQIKSEKEQFLLKVRVHSWDGAQGVRLTYRLP